MNDTLRPSTLGEILDRTAQLYRRNFWLFAGIAAVPIGVMLAIAVVAVVLAVIAGFSLRSAIGSPVAAGLVAIVFVLVALPIYIAAYVFCCAGVTQAAVSAQRGEKLTIREDLASVLPRFWTYLGFLILQGVLVILIPGAIAGAVVGTLFFLMSSVSVGVSVALGFLIFLVVVAAVGVIAWLGLGYSMGMAVCVVERMSPWESMQRAMHLSKGTRGRIFVMFILVVCLGMIVSAVAYIPLMAVVAVLTASGTNLQSATSAIVAADVLNVVVNMTLQVALTPVSWIALVLFYYDQRIRKEGFDIERMMELAGMTQPPPATLLSPGGEISSPVPPPDTVGER
jgi:hypothetical protein